MSDSKNSDPVMEPPILRKGHNEFLTIDRLFGVMRCRVIPPKDLYFPVLPDRSDNGKIIYHLNTMEGTWSSVELQKAISLCYIIDETYEQHHFEEKKYILFRYYNKTFLILKGKQKWKVIKDKKLLRTCV